MVGHDFQYPSAAKAFKRLGRWVGLPFLRRKDGMTGRRPNRFWEAAQILLRRSQRTGFGWSPSIYISIRLIVYPFPRKSAWVSYCEHPNPEGP